MNARRAGIIVAVDVFALIFLLGFAGGASLVGLAWIGWWHWEKSRPIHCYGCTCFVPNES